ncbi:MAG: hypothetical protein AAGM22_30985 [Acidobacteriota bacterium]
MDRPPVDVLHHQVGTAVGRGAAFVERGDVRMLELGQNLPFDDEPLDQLGDVKAGPQHLDGDAALELIVFTLGQEHHAHSAGADRLYDAVWAEALTRFNALGAPRGIDDGRIILGASDPAFNFALELRVAEGLQVSLA